MNDIAYTLYLFEDALEQVKMEEFTHEAVALSSPEVSLTDMKLIQESFKEKIKNIFDKLILNIKNIWSKFVNALDDFIKNDVEYLKKYRETIIGKPLKNDVYVMYKYWDGERELETSKIPAFNMSTFKDKTKEDMEAMLGSQYKIKDKTISDAAKYIFRGKLDQETKIKSANIPMSKLYDFCINYKKFKELLTKDMKEVEKAAGDAIVLIDRLPTNESALYSFFDESVIYEEVKKIGADGQKGTADDKPAKDAPSSSIDKSNTGDEKELKDVVTDRNKDIETCKMYITVFMGFLGAKMTILEETYKAYMFIIRDHVKLQTSNKSSEDKVGTPDKEEDKKKEDTKSPEEKKKDDNDGNASDEKDIKFVDKVANATKAVGKAASKILKGGKKEEPKK